MKKMSGMFALCVVGLSIASAFAQDPAAPVAATPAVPEQAPVIAAPAAPVAQPAAPQEITVKGKVNKFINPTTSALQSVYINPVEPGSHPYKVDIVNGIGKTLAEQHGKIVEAVGVEANRLFTIKTFNVIE